MNNQSSVTDYIGDCANNDPKLKKIMVALAIPRDLDDEIAWKIISFIKPDAEKQLLWTIENLDIVCKKPDGTFYLEREARAELLSLVFAELDEELRQKIHQELLDYYYEKLEAMGNNSQSSLYFENCLKIKIGYHLIWLNRPEAANIVWQSILDGYEDERSKIFIQAAISFVNIEHDVLSNYNAQMLKIRERFAPT